MSKKKKEEDNSPPLSPISPKAQTIHRFVRQLFRNHGHALREVHKSDDLRATWELFIFLKDTEHWPVLYNLLTWRSEVVSLRSLAQDQSKRLHDVAKELSLLKYALQVPASPLNQAPDQSQNLPQDTDPCSPQE